jgi:hypothetical protein
VGRTLECLDLKMGTIKIERSRSGTTAATSTP